MSRHFGPQHMRNGYAAMGAAKRRPIYASASGRSVADSIARARAAAARAAKIKKK